MRKAILLLTSLVLTACSIPKSSDIVIDNDVFTLVVGEDACAKSLTIKESGERMLSRHSGRPLFSVTQKRPFNNEIKLENPNTTPEMWNFADSLAAECGCPVTIQMNLESLENHPQSEELLSVLRKWEEYRSGCEPRTL